MDALDYTIKIDTFDDSDSECSGKGVEDRRTEVGAGQQVCTRPAVARFMLDVAGYTADQPLHRLRFVDPAAGPGVFFLEALDRLLAAWRADPDARIEQLAQAIRAVEIDAAIAVRLRARVRARLGAAGFAPSDVERLVEEWCVEADFLAPCDYGPVDVIAGNPPFRRYDALSAAERTRFQQQFTTFSGRCDLYVVFIERALSLLAEGGTLAVITPDRWQRTQYGAELRKLVAAGYHLRAQVDATAQPVFNRDVAAYPGISVISRSPAGPTRVARIQSVTDSALAGLAKTLTTAELDAETQPTVHLVPGYARDHGPWWRGTPSQVALVDRLSRFFPPLSAIGCRVGNGLATGANKVFIARSEDDALSSGVEPAFWIPTVVPSDVATGTIAWSGHHLLNVWTPDGELVNPSDHPGLLAYLQANHAQLARRYVARARPEAWYRSLDRPQPGLLKTPKLLIADIQKAPRFALDEGHFYPRNGVYYVLSEHWPLSALRLVLESGLAHLFIAAASTTVRGGGFRCQAQYLRSIPLRPWRELAVPLRRALMAAAAAPTPRPDLLARIFELTPDEQQVIAAAAEVDG